MAIDIEHLPEDPKILQKMVQDLTAQLDRESAERHKVETILRELLEARRNRKSEQLSADQLALFAAIWEASQKTEATKSDEEPKDQDNELDIGKVLLTKVGEELATVCRVPGVAGFLDYVKEKWKSHLAEASEA